jgi:hypothetical protein
MELRNRETGDVITESQFRSEHTDSNLPLQLTTKVANDFGYDLVLEGEKPQVTYPYEVIIRDGVENINGKWYTRYIIGPIFVDTEEQTAAEQESSYRAYFDNYESDSIRNIRNAKLKESDWTQLLNSPVDVDAWSTYRQALRDVPQQEGFPWNITWPEEPNRV